MRKVLVADRGEMAVRVSRACRDAGIASVAVYTEPDRDAMHVCAADEAYALGGEHPAGGYRNVTGLLRAAADAGTDAVHPGCGLLAENADFAQAVLDAGMVWIGPPPQAIRALERAAADDHPQRTRRLSTQCLADRHGNVAVLSTCDRTIRVGHHELIEEAPAPFLSEAQDSLLREESRAILGKAGYVGAGSCEFLLAPDGTVSFLGVIPRLGTGHPAIEEITGIDLVREQLRLADGAALDGADPRTRGHAIGFRVTAADPGREFAPTPGTVRVFIAPSGPGVRLDTGVRPGSVARDPLLATLTITGATRTQALERATRALAEFAVDGIATTIPFHRAVLVDPAFRGEPERVHTRWVETEFDNRIPPYTGTPSQAEEGGRETVVVEVGGKRIEVSVPATLAVSAANAARAGTRRRYVRERNQDKKRDHMHSNLIVARMEPASRAAVAELFADFDTTEMPRLMGTRRRQLFSYRGLYFHVQDFDSDNGGELIEEAKTDPRFIKISADLKAFIGAYDPATWRSPADAMATRFYNWEAST